MKIRRHEFPGRSLNQLWWKPIYFHDDPLGAYARLWNHSDVWAHQQFKAFLLVLRAMYWYRFSFHFRQPILVLPDVPFRCDAVCWYISNFIMAKICCLKWKWKLLKQKWFCSSPITIRNRNQLFSRIIAWIAANKSQCSAIAFSRLTSMPMIV